MNQLTQKLKNKNFLKGILGVFFVVLVCVFGYLLWNFLTTPTTLSTITDSLGEQGIEIKDSFSTTPAMPLSEEDKAFVFQDTKGGIEIQYAGQENKPENGIKVSLPKNYSEPIAIKLDEERVVTIKDNTIDSYEASLLETDAITEPNETSLRKFLNPNTEEGNTSYLKYENQRKSLLYAYQKDTATGERKLKHWTLYNKGTGEEKESYTIENATIKKNDNGDINVYFESEQDLKNQAAAKEVDPSLLERAQRTLEKELGTNPNQEPDFVIPKPYYVDTKSQRQDLDWNIDEEKKTISLEFKVSKDQYPIALDPTLQFTAPGVSNGGLSITGEATSNSLGNSLATGDINSDGKTDLIIGASTYSSNAGRVYIFYNDGSIPTTAATADVTITGEASSVFGAALATGDFNSDGSVDLAIGAQNYSTATGRTYIFYNDGSIPTTAATADITITGESALNTFGYSLTTGDINSDGKTDLIIGASTYSSNAGRVYIFYNDGSIPTTAATADVTITGEASSVFGTALTSGDFNSDSKTDLVVGASGYSSGTGRAYIFYNDGSIPTTAATADVTITGEATVNNFGAALIAGDLNSNGKIDLVVGASGYSSGTGRAYIFYNDGSIPTTAVTADVTITGESSSSFGITLTAEDLNSDGKTDLVVGASAYSSNTGRAYIFYNDSSIPTGASSADVTITGEVSSSLGVFLARGDLNSDGKTDLIVGAAAYLASTGRAYIFYSQNGVLNTNQNITGEAVSAFGTSIIAGDFNTDGRSDLVVGAPDYSTSTGRTYIFYNDGSIPTTAATADITITGGATDDLFGGTLTTGDLNSDGRTDLVIGAYGYSTSTGRAYIYYNDGSIPITAATADVIITGGATDDIFGVSVATGDLNTDGRTDLVVGATEVSSSVGAAYIFYNDGSIPTTAATADVTITGEASSVFGDSLTTGDLNSDGRIDLAVGAIAYSTNTGRAYIFYNDGSIPTAASSADVTISGETTNNLFGTSLTTGDLNNDGRIDLAVGASGYSTTTGRAYIFYNDGSIPTTAATADVIIAGEAGGYLGFVLIAKDLNSDSKTDLIIGAYLYGVGNGRTYIFYNDGSIPTTAATADMTITGESTSYFGYALAIEDMNSDGRVDLIVGASNYSSGSGGVFFYNGQDNFSWNLQTQPIGGNRIQPNVTGEELQITGEIGSGMGNTFATGDLNSDGKTDLIVGARSYASSTGRVYVFYGDGGYQSGASSADIVITGNATSDAFGTALATGDLNSDGRVDLVVGASGYSSNTGQAYIFHNDGAVPTTASSADVTITGGGTSRYFGVTLSTGDFDNSGTTDVVIGVPASGIITSKTLIYYNDGSIPTTEGTADVTLSGGILTDFGAEVASGDMNADGTVDLIVGAPIYSVSNGTGLVSIYYNDGSYGAADVSITGESTNNYFGSSLAVGDFNSDGKTDLIAGAYGYNADNQGRAYVFYNDGSIPTTAATADVTITGNTAGDSFGSSVASGDLNTDGRTDIIIGAYSYSSSTGRAYIFYNDGSIPTTAATADVTLTGEATSSSYGTSLMTGDFNADGRADLAIGATGYSSSKGRIYLYTFNDGETTGSATSDYFGESMTSGDFNADGKIDLAVGAYGYSSSTGRVYIFYGKNGNISTIASGADVTITGNAAGDTFGDTLIAGDLNADGETDLVVGATGYSTNTGRAYIFYSDGSIPTTAATADVTITGESTNDYFGYAFATGDMNTDGEIDLVVSANRYNGNRGRVYMFHNDGSYTSAAGSADSIIDGVAIHDTLGSALATGDVNSDGETDLLVGANSISSSGFTTEVYIFYNDGSYPASLSSADITITSEAVTQKFGSQIVTGDFNTDGRVDFATSAIYPTAEKVYTFYNDGSIPTTAATADVIIDNEANSDAFGVVLGAADMNADGKTDLIVSAQEITTNTGRAYIFYNDGSYPALAASADKIYSGTATSNYFGSSFSSLDFNFDGIQDLAIGAYGYSTNTGRVYTIASEVDITTEAESTATTSLKGGTIQMKGSGIKMR